MARIDRIKEKLEKGTLVLGSHVTSTDPGLTEVMAASGVDFVWVEWEHSAFNRETVLAHVRAAQSRGCCAFVRVAWNDPVIAKPVLEMGIDGIVFPMIRTAEEARAAVDATTYPPAGSRGCGPMRASLHGLTPFPEYLAQADRSIWRIMQIEHVDAVKNLEEILAVPGVDAIVVGMFDLSGSMGHLGELDHPEVVALMDEIARKAEKSHVWLGLSSGFQPAWMEYWMKKGLKWLSVGNEFDFMLMASRQVFGNCQAMYEQARQGGD